MKKLMCSQCGASLNPKTLTCEYCGSVFFDGNKNVNTNTQTETLNQEKTEVKQQLTVRELTDEELSKLVNNFASNDKQGFVVFFIFMAVWIGIAVAIFISSLGASEIGEIRFSFVSVIPLLFVAFGVFMVISNIKNVKEASVKNEVKLIKNGEFQKAHDSLKERERKKHNKNYVAGLILLDYFRLNKFEEAKMHILSLSQPELVVLIRQSNVILEIARHLGVKTPDWQITYYSSGRSRNSSYNYRRNHYRRRRY